MRWAGKAIAFVAIAVGLVAAGWWAGQSALEPPADPLAAPAPVSIEVVDGTVGRSLPLSATARWATVGVVRAAASGVVTSVDVDPAVPVGEGGRLTSVDLVATYAAVGAVPAFRELAPGVRGADVAQLEAFLARSGHDPGLEDGSFSSATGRAVRAWQTAAGAPVTGTVPLGSLVFVPALPARARPVVEVGASIGAGETLVELVAQAPEFTIGLTPEQVTLIPPEAAVRLTGSKSEWAATGGRVDIVEGSPVMRLLGVDGQSVCGLTCADVPLVSESSWAAEVILVPEVTGSVVPVGAVQTGPDGARFVVNDAGNEVPVEVLGSADGQAVVEGVQPGDRVLLPALPP